MSDPSTDLEICLLETERLHRMTQEAAKRWICLVVEQEVVRPVLEGTTNPAQSIDNFLTSVDFAHESERPELTGIQAGIELFEKVGEVEEEIDQDTFAYRRKYLERIATEIAPEFDWTRQSFGWSSGVDISVMKQIQRVVLEAARPHLPTPQTVVMSPENYRNFQAHLERLAPIGAEPGLFEGLTEAGVRLTSGPVSNEKLYRIPSNTGNLIGLLGPPKDPREEP